MYYVRRNGNESSKKAERNFILLVNEPASLIFKFDNALAVSADYSFCPKQRLLRLTAYTSAYACVRISDTLSSRDLLADRRVSSPFPVVVYNICKSTTQTKNK